MPGHKMVTVGPKGNCGSARFPSLLVAAATVLTCLALPGGHARSLQQGGVSGDSIRSFVELSGEIAAVLDDVVNKSPQSGAATAFAAPARDDFGAVLDAVTQRSPSDDSPDEAAITRTYTLYQDTECASSRVLAEKKEVQSVEACQVLCDARKACKAFTYNPDTSKCFLVPDCKERGRDVGNVSGVEAAIVRDVFIDEEIDEDPDVKQFNTYKDIGCADGAFREINDIATPDDCQQICYEEEQCKAYTFNPDKARCFLAASCTMRETEDGNTSGVETITDEKATEYNLYERTGCSGETLAHKGGFSSVEQCQAWCEARNWQGCGAFVYSPGRNRCYLKRDCNDRKIEPENVSGVKLAGDECAISPACATDDLNKVCPEVTETRGEMADPIFGAFEPPYEGIRYRPTYNKRKEYPTCNFQPPRDPLPKDWVDECIDNMRGVGYLQERKRRPNNECPAGWFLCKGMCYTLAQRNNRGPDRTWYYEDDYMFVESRCGLCGGARVAFVGDDPDMQRVAAEAAEQTLNEDKASWVRRFRFLEERNRKVERARPYQPWHLYIEMYADNKTKMTYQRYTNGKKDRRDLPGWDGRYRNQEASILCVNTVQRIQQAVKYPNDSNLTMERGCRGRNHNEMWDNDEHRWRPERHYPFPGH